MATTTVFDEFADNAFQNMSQMLFNSGPMQYEMFNYGTTPATYYPSTNSNKISVEYTGSSTLDERDRRRRRSGSTSTTSTKDKETLTNMHLVSPTDATASRDR
jgi:hypothetical protein